MDTLEKIKKIRSQSGAGLADIKQALEKSQGDEKRALEILREQGRLKASQKSQRQTKEGVIACYLHPNKRLGAMVKLYCETDFVARNVEFQELAKDLAMHIAAMNPQYLSPEEVAEELLEEERRIWRRQLEEEKKPAAIIPKILAGKEEKLRKEISLLTQTFVKNNEISVGELIEQKVAKIGENIRVGEFVRHEL